MSPELRKITSAHIRRDGFVPKREDLPSDAWTHAPIIRKLANEILPWFVSAEELRKKPLYRAHTLYSWTRDIFTAMTGFGLSHPLAKVISGENPDFMSSLSKMPLWLYIATGGSAVMWVILKAYVTRDDGEKRSILARSCRKEFMGLNLGLRNVLMQPNPQKAFVPLQAELAALVQRHIAEGSWFFPNDDVLAPGIHEKVRKRCVDLVVQNYGSWDLPSQEGDVDQHEPMDPTPPHGHDQREHPPGASADRSDKP